MTPGGSSVMNVKSQSSSCDFENNKPLICFIKLNSMQIISIPCTNPDKVLFTFIFLTSLVATLPLFELYPNETFQEEDARQLVLYNAHD